MHLKITLCFLLIILLSCSKTPETASTQGTQDTEISEDQKNGEAAKIIKILYVNSPDGLRVRSSPNLDGEKIGVLGYLAEAAVIKEAGDDINIDGKIGKWNLIKFEDTEGWVFGAYLESVDIIKKNLIGDWFCNGGNYLSFYSFHSDGTWRTGLFETSYSADGNWQIYNDRLLVENIIGEDDSGEKSSSYSREWQFYFLGKNKLKLIYHNKDTNKTSEEICRRFDLAQFMKDGYNFTELMSSFEKD